jgi:RNA polymerase sigma-70 factor (ECF subfamily)
MTRSRISTAAHTPPPEPDRALLTRAAGGDERAFARLVGQYEQLVYRFAYHVCRDADKAEETWQDTFVNVYRKLHQFDGKSKFSTWFYRIVTNNCLMKRRHRKIDDLMDRYDDPHGMEGPHLREGGRDQVRANVSWKETPLSLAEETELRAALDVAILKLPVDYRVVFVLRDVEGRSAEETAKILRLSVPAVKSRLRRARVFLREQLNEYVTR